MYHPTNAIVLSSIKYGDSSRILRCYTREFGLVGYLVSSVNSKKSIVKPGMLLPLTQLSLVATYKAKGTLERIKDAGIHRQNGNMHQYPVRNALALFLAELLSKSIKEESPNPEKFDFIAENCQILATQAEISPHFHLQFMAQLTTYLGFAPNFGVPQNHTYFDLAEGIFTAARPLHPYFMDKSVSAGFVQLFSGEKVQLPKKLRQALMQDLLQYYRIHIAEFGQLKSVEVLAAVFND